MVFNLFQRRPSTEPTDNNNNNNKFSAIPSPRRCSTEMLRGFWADYDTFIFDADGVLWVGEQAVPGAPELLAKLVEAGKNVFVLTNNATRSPQTYTEKFGKLGFRGQSQKMGV